MYLSEEKREEIRKCIEIQQRNSGKDIINTDTGFHGAEDRSKVSQILFDARDGKEVFTPF